MAAQREREVFCRSVTIFDVMEGSWVWGGGGRSGGDRLLTSGRYSDTNF